MRSRLLQPAVAAAALAAATGVLLPAAPATAAACSGDTGVTVVVDGSGTYGGIATTCVADGGGDSAADLFEVSHDLTRVQNFQGAVCKVDLEPENANCTRMPPSNAYWGLFWSDGSGEWTYSSEGVDSLDVPDGGGVAFVWQDGGDQDYPGAAAAGSQPSPTTSTSASGGSGSGSGGSGSGGAGSGGSASSGGGAAGGSGAGVTSTTSGAAAGHDRRRARAGADDRDRDGRQQRENRRHDRGDARDATAPPAGPTSAPTQEATDDVAAAAEPPAGAADQGLPVWLPPSLAGGIFVAAGAVALARRRQAG